MTPWRVTPLRTGRAGDGKKGKKGKGGGGSSDGVAVVVPSAEERVKAMDVFVDVALSLLASPSRLMRDAVNTAFRAFVSDATPAAIEALMKVVMPKSGGEKEGDDSKIYEHVWKYVQPGH